MNTLRSFLILAALGGVLSMTPSAGAQGTAFTYEGVLNLSGAPVNGATDLTFTLFDAASGGLVVGTSNVLAGVSIDNGLFSTLLDFGAGAFNGSPRWLEIAARPAGSDGGYTALAPRQAITPAPYAIYSTQAGVSLAAASVSGPVSAGQITGTLPLGRLPAAVVTNGSAALRLSGSFSGLLLGSAAGVSNLNLTAASAGAIQRPVSFADPKYYGVGRVPMSLIAADPKQDGNLGLAIADYNDSVVELQYNDGHGGFFTSTPVKVGTFPSQIISADLFNSGLPVYVTANSGTNTLTLIKGKPGGTLNAQVITLNVGKNPSGVVAADVNRDGYLDLISADSADNTLTVLTNNRAGGFGFNAVLKVGAYPMSVAAADFDGNGYPDLVCANNSDATLTLLLNQGGVFSTGMPIPVGNSPRTVLAVDVNGDGAADLVSANYADNTVSVLRNNGAASFGPAATIAVGSHPFSVAAADFLGIGIPSLVTANTSSGSVTVLANDGAGGFTANATLLAGPGPQGLVVADFNRDGHPDIVTGNTSDSPKPTLCLITSSTGLEFLGNVGIGTSTPSSRLDVNGEITCIAMNLTSDRNAKEGFEPVDARDVLEKVARMPITRWQYRSQPDTRHIGPMAQDFHEAFAVGRDERHIASVDEDGVALAAIQGLNAKLEERLIARESEVLQLQREHQILEERLAALERRLASGGVKSRATK